MITLNGKLLFEALHFVCKAIVQNIAYTKLVEISCKDTEVILKLHGDTLPAISCSYKDQFSNELSSVVVSAPALLNFVSANKANSIQVESGEKSVTFKGKGRLVLSHIPPDNYEMCDFGSDLYKMEIGEGITISSPETIENFFSKIHRLTSWADDTASSPQFKNICFERGIGCARQQKSNLSIIDTAIVGDELQDLRKEFHCETLVDVSFLDILSRLQGITSLTISFQGNETNYFTSFLAYRPDINMYYHCIGRTIRGKHSIQEIISMINILLIAGCYFSVNKKELLSLIRKAKGYSDSDQTGILGIGEDALNLYVSGSYGTYSNSIPFIATTVKTGTEFLMSLDLLEKIMYSIPGEEVSINIGTNPLTGAPSRFAIVSGTVKYLFPAYSKHG